MELELLRLSDCFGVACCKGVVEVEARVTRRGETDVSNVYCCKAPWKSFRLLGTGSDVILMKTLQVNAQRSTVSKESG